MFIVPKSKNDSINLKTKQYNEGSGSKTAAEYLKEKSNDISVTNYNDGNKGEMYTFNHEATDQTPALTDYRYIGNEPNNYVKFNCDDDGSNCETWRIIGVFDVDDGTGNFEQRIKLIRGSSFATEMYWNTESNGYGYNDWTADNASLKNFLNEDYYNQLGDAATYGLKTSAKSIIDNAVYYLGARTYDSTTHFGSTEEVYVWERGNIPCGACNSDTTRLTWTGKVGLMYPSDEYMVYGNGVNMTCYNDPNQCNDSSNASKGWIYNSNIREGQSSPDYTWFLSSYSGDNYPINVVFVFNATNSEFLSDGYSVAYSFDIGVRPVVYLKSNIYINDGDGSVDNPYSLSLNSPVDENNIDDDSNNDNNNDDNSDDNSDSIVVDNSNESTSIVTVANTLNYISWIIIILSVAIVIMGCFILGYNYYKSRKERK